MNDLFEEYRLVISQKKIKDLVRYFRNSGLSTIVFHVQCNFVITTTSVKIGHGYKKFCAFHSLKEKGYVIFEVESEKTSMDVKVLYNLPYL